MKQLSGNAGEFFNTYPEEQKEGEENPQTCLFPISSSSRKLCRAGAAQVEQVLGFQKLWKRGSLNRLKSNVSFKPTSFCTQHLIKVSALGIVTLACFVGTSAALWLFLFHTLWEVKIKALLYAVSFS